PFIRVLACIDGERVTRPDALTSLLPQRSITEDRFRLLCDELRRACTPFGEDVTQAILDLVATVPNAGSHEQYIEAVLALVRPRQQACVDAMKARIEKLAAETDA